MKYIISFKQSYRNNKSIFLIAIAILSILSLTAGTVSARSYILNKKDINKVKNIKKPLLSDKKTTLTTKENVSLSDPKVETPTTNSNNPNKITDSPRGYGVPVGWDRDLNKELPRLNVSLGNNNVNLSPFTQAWVDLVSNYPMASKKIYGYDSSKVNIVVTGNGNSSFQGNNILNQLQITYVGGKEEMGSTNATIEVTNYNGDAVTLTMNISWDYTPKPVTFPVITPQ